jgi:hypothetical protein
MASGSVILSKKDGTAVTELEARRLLDRYGRIEVCVPANSRNNNLDGMFIKFAFYLDCQDALKVRIPRSWRLGISANREKLGSSKHYEPLHPCHCSRNGTTSSSRSEWISYGPWLPRSTFYSRHKVDLRR